ncbi:methionyl-tRNA formyltransferase [Cytophaga hutchinsonii]|uniref:Methionyl-tRNA formyltransferase n=1 Tax=Cytophaga hutchinsonii (strain ATCC 33406 / DSM 1761 / CIP 103989 / NBRC 15051 / NCIMB 9469 / D465) TaxID=269798 RepID=A0A6N4SRC6_CYTH3|nr:methionyl-tRNA formyltransferase [Cytophaga hutchinsonii]ABG58841.1 methionyl-tRNA formyltransferase [Cytophaga hutchinsonii ATCC 33406]
MKLRIIYMGTPDFAVPSLEILIENGFDVAAVVTAPDKPAGRGLKIQYSAVKEAALKHNIPVLQPEKLKDERFIEELISYNANLFIVVAFRMLPEIIWQMPSIGTFNLHGSLLPKYQGAAPINWAIINGETETGCTTFFLKHQIDTGDIILQDKTPILPDDTFETVYNKLKVLGADLVLKTVRMIESETYTSTPQKGQAIHAPKIYKETGAIDWNNSCIAINNLIRGLNPFPSAWFVHAEKTYKVFKAIPEVTQTNAAIGSIKSDNKTGIKVACADGWLSLIEIQAEGKKRMSVQDFLKGNKI